MRFNALLKKNEPGDNETITQRQLHAFTPDFFMLLGT